MNRTAQIKENQTLIDFALQHCGNVSAVLDIARLNDLNVTDYVEAGTLLQLPDIAFKQVFNYYLSRGINVVTGTDQGEPSESGSGTSSFVDVKYDPPRDNYKVNEYQSLLDVAIELYGGIEAAWMLAKENEISMTADLWSGQELVKNASLISQPVVDYYQDNDLISATAYIETDTGEGVQEGIGYWAIEIDFIVS